MAATPEVFTIKKADGVTIVTPPGLSREEAVKAAKTKRDLLVAQYGSKKAIPPGEYDSQEGIIPLPDEAGTDWYPGQIGNLFGEKLESGAAGLGSAWKTSKLYSAGILRDETTDQDIKARELVLKQEAEDRAKTESPSVQFTDIVNERRRQKLLNYYDAGDMDVPEEEKEMFKKSFPYQDFDEDAPEQSITNMVARWAVGGIAESLPFMGPTLLGGIAGMEVVPDQLRKIPVIGKKLDPIAKTAGFVIGSTIAGIPQFLGSNLERRIEEGQVTAEEFNSPHAMSAAIGQSVADSLLFALLGRYGGTLQKTHATEMLKHIAKGTALGGATEVPTEVLQQVLERAQAGLTIDPRDEEALREYINSGTLALVAGSTLGGAVSSVQAYTKKNTGTSSLTISDMSDMSGPLASARKAKAGKLGRTLQEEVEFSVDVPKGPIPFESLPESDTPVIDTVVDDEISVSNQLTPVDRRFIDEIGERQESSWNAILTENDLLRIWNNNAFGIDGATFEESFNRLDTNNRFDIKKQANGEETFTAIREEFAVSPSSTLTKNTLEERVLKSIRNKNLTIDEITDVLEKSFTKEETFASGNKSYMAIRNAIEDLKQKGRIEDAGPSTNAQGREAGSFKAVKEEKAKRKKLAGLNNIRVNPGHSIYKDANTSQKYLFEKIEGEAKVRLFYGRLVERDAPKPNEDGTFDSESRVEYLIDPETGTEVFGDYDIQEFIPPGKTEPEPRLLDNMIIEVNGEKYKPFWQDVKDTNNKPLKSFADLPMGLHPEMQVAGPRTGTLNIRGAFKGKKLDPKIIPEGATEAEIREQIKASNTVNFLLKQTLSAWIAPKGVMPETEYDTLLKQKWLNRGSLREIQSLNVQLEKGVGLIPTIKKYVNNQRNFRRDTKQTLEKYWTGVKGTTLQDIKDLGHTQEFVDAVIEMRNIVDKNAKLIVNLLDKLDPNKEKYSEALRQAIRNRISSYMSQAYEMYTTGEWKPPNRLLASKREKKLHDNAVDWLASNLRKQNQVTPGQSSHDLANEMLDRLYNKETSAEAFGQIVGETLAEPLPDIVPTDTTGIRIDAPQGILQAKAVVPKPIKAVMGEITDPGARMILTVAKQSEFINGLTALNDLFNQANEPGNRWISRIPQGRFDTLITGSELNPFAGYYSTKSIVQGLNDALGTGLIGGAFNVESMAGKALSGTIKYGLLVPQTWTRGGKILYSPTTQTRNLVAGAGFVTVNGHLNPKNTLAAMRAAGSYIRGLTTPQAKRLVDLGVFNTSPLLGDLARTFELAGRADNVHGIIETIQEQQRSITKPFKGKFGEFARKTYQFGDDFWKGVMYFGEMDKYTKIFQMPTQMDPKSSEFDEMKSKYGDNYWTALMDPKSPEFSEMVEENIKIIEELMERGDRRPLQLNSSTPETRLYEALEELAAYRTRQNVPNYDALGKFQEVLRFGPTGDFIAFPTEQVRTSANTVTSGLIEIKVGQKLNKQGGRKKALGTAIATRGRARVFSFTLYNTTVGLGLRAIAPALKGLGWGAAGVLGLFAPSWGEDRNKILVSVDSRTGDVTTADLSGTDAYDVITEPLRTAERQVNSAEDTIGGIASGMAKGVAEGIVNFFAPYITPSIYAKAMTMAWTGQNSSGKEIRNSRQSFPNQIGDTITALIDELQPGGVVDIRKALGAMGVGAEQRDRFNREQTLSDVAKKGFGTVLTHTNFPTSWSNFQLSSFVNEARKAERIYKLEQYAGGRETLTVADIIEGYKEANDLYLDLVLAERNRINAVGDISISPETMFGGIPDDKLSNLSGRDKDNLQIDDLPNKDGSYNDTTFTPINPRDFYTQTKEKLIEVLAKDGVIDERLEAMEFPQEALDQLELSYAEIVLEGYTAPDEQSDVMEEALKYFRSFD